jgi:hypothetical protein
MIQPQVSEENLGLRAKKTPKLWKSGRVSPLNREIPLEGLKQLKTDIETKSSTLNWDNCQIRYLNGEIMGQFVNCPYKDLKN